LLRADLHIHTCYSPDCRSRLKDVVARCQERGINCLAVTDHGTVEGGLRLREMAPFTVIVGEEVRTPAGEVIGLFLSETIPNGISLEATINRIKEQGGLVGVPHPFMRFGRSALSRNHTVAFLDEIDFIEVFNARSWFARESELARGFAQHHGLIGSAGSDAHTLNEIGHAYVEMPEFATKQEFLQSLAQGRICGRRSGFSARFASLGLLFRHLCGDRQC